MKYDGHDENGLCDWRDVDGDLLGLGGGDANATGVATPCDAPPSLLLLPSCEFADCPPAVSRFATSPSVRPTSV